MNSVTKECSNSNSNYHNVKYTILVTETMRIIIRLHMHCVVIVVFVSAKVGPIHTPPSLTLKQKSMCRCRKVMFTRRRRWYRMSLYMIWTLPMLGHRYSR